MKKVVALPAAGARISGPAVVKLTKKQYERRAHILGPFRKNGVYDLDGGQEILIKRGEVVGIERLSKVSKAQFEEVGAGPVTEPEPGTGKGAVVTTTQEPTQGASDEVQTVRGPDAVSADPEESGQDVDGGAASDTKADRKSS